MTTPITKEQRLLDTMERMGCTSPHGPFVQPYELAHVYDAGDAETPVDTLICVALNRLARRGKLERYKQVVEGGKAQYVFRLPGKSKANGNGRNGRCTQTEPLPFVPTSASLQYDIEQLEQRLAELESLTALKERKAKLQQQIDDITSQLTGA